ncbi:hypothetical protein C7B61_17860 [filamentous cyanobacterium CCP1]|nr:hypothetical protein C7B76_00515 [filamentous cyanobacterium CCP2]PSB60211.1 hypothetical protein C7B61_17860 [filamentous cyanobacterium CCP1]
MPISQESCPIIFLTTIGSLFKHSLNEFSIKLLFEDAFMNEMNTLFNNTIKVNRSISNAVEIDRSKTLPQNEVVMRSSRLGFS